MTFLRTSYIQVEYEGEVVEARCKYWVTYAVPVLWLCPAEPLTIELTSVVVNHKEVVSTASGEFINKVEDLIYKEYECGF